MEIDQQPSNSMLRSEDIENINHLQQSPQSSRYL